MLTGTVPALSSLAALAADIAAARAVMAPAMPATVLRQAESARAFEGRFSLERIPMPAEGDPEAAARAFNEITRPHFARGIRPLFDERLALEALASRGIQLDVLGLIMQIPDAAAAGLITYGIAEGFLVAAEGRLNGLIDQGLRILDRAPAPEPWRDPALVIGMGGMMTGIAGMALQSHFSFFMALWAVGTLSLAYGIGRVNSAYAAMRRHVGDLLEELSGEFRSLEEAQRRLRELRPEILRAAEWSGDQAVTRLRPPSLER